MGDDGVSVMVSARVFHGLSTRYQQARSFLSLARHCCCYSTRIRSFMLTQAEWSGNVYCLCRFFALNSSLTCFSFTTQLSVIRLSSSNKMPADLLNPTAELETRTHKLKRLVQSPNSFFMDIKCPGCFQITTVFSHAQTVVLCGNCNVMLCQPTGGRARLTEGCSYRKKVE